MEVQRDTKLSKFTLDSLTTLVTTTNLEPSPRTRARRHKNKGRAMKVDEDDDDPMARAHRAKLSGGPPSLSEQHRDLVRELRKGKIAARTIHQVEAQVAPMAATVLRGIAEERARAAEREQLGEAAFAAELARAAALGSGAATPVAAKSAAGTPRDGGGDGEEGTDTPPTRRSLDSVEAREAEENKMREERAAEAEAAATAELIRSLAVELVASEGVEKAYIDASRQKESERDRIEKKGGQLPWLVKGDAAIDVERQIKSYQLERSGGPRPLHLKMQYPSPLVHQAARSSGRMAAQRAASLDHIADDEAAAALSCSKSAFDLQVAAETTAVHSVPVWVHAKRDIGVFPHHASGPFHERRAAKLDARARTTRDSTQRTTLLAQAALERQTARRQFGIMEKEKRKEKGMW